MLSGCIYTLLGTNISHDILNETERKLNLFVQEYQTLHGETKMVMNMHLVKHLVGCVRQLGPLWAQSLFVYEDFNGYLLKLVSGPTNVMTQISSKYCLQRTYNKNENINSVEISPKSKLLGRGSSLELNSLNDKERGAILNIVQPEKYIFKHLRLSTKKGIIYTSIAYKRAERTIDYFIGVKDGSIGAVQYYLNIDGICYCLLNVYRIISCINQFNQVEITADFVLVRAEEIQEKLMYVSVGDSTYFVRHPNYFEKD